MTNEILIIIAFLFSFFALLIWGIVKLLKKNIKFFEDKKFHSYHHFYGKGQLHIYSDSKMKYSFGLLGKGKIYKISDPSKKIETFKLAQSNDEKSNYLFMFKNFCEQNNSELEPKLYLPVSGCKLLTTVYSTNIYYYYHSTYKNSFCLIEGSSDFIIKVVDNNKIVSFDRYVNGKKVNFPFEERKKFNLFTFSELNPVTIQEISL